MHRMGWVVLAATLGCAHQTVTQPDTPGHVDVYRSVGTSTVKPVTAGFLGFFGVAHTIAGAALLMDYAGHPHPSGSGGGFMSLDISPAELALGCVSLGLGALLLTGAVLLSLD